jgi:hypothetical protein
MGFTSVCGVWGGYVKFKLMIKIIPDLAAGQKNNHLSVLVFSLIVYG